MLPGEKHRPDSVLPAPGFSRRRFLASLGLLAGAGVAAPLWLGARSRRMASVELARPGLGTWIRIVARHEDTARAQRAVEAAFAAIRRVDEQMSVHRADSQLARVNGAAGEAEAAVDLAVIEVVRRACAAADRSAGVYDPTVLPLMRLYGFYGAGRNEYPSDREIGAAMGVVGWGGVTLDEGRGRLGLARRGAGLDLGSIGKGWAVDRAVEALRRHGIESGLVDAGGNVYGLGTPEEGAAGWTVGVPHPVTGRMDRVFLLRNSAVATSANTEQHRVLSGVRVGHLFDARRGRPADGHLSASIQARTGMDSDVFSTVAFLLGPDRFRGWGALDSHFVG